MLATPASKVAKTGPLHLGGQNAGAASWLPEEPLTGDMFKDMSFASLPLNLEALSTGLPHKSEWMASGMHVCSIVCVCQ